MADAKEDLESLFARRREIDRALLEEHSKDVAILFTDIVGSTQFFEAKGDIAGLELVRRHNALLFPIVQSNGGWIVKTIGDAIMAVFVEPARAVACGVQMQRALAQENTRGADPIHIRVGAHCGRALVEEGKDVYGDAVNLAARVVNEARADEIIISRALADRLTAQDGFPTEPRGSFQPKGKSEPVPVVLVHWKDGATAGVTAGAPAEASARTRKAPEIFVLELQVGAKGLKVAAMDGAADKGTVKSYADVEVSRTKLQTHAEQFDNFMRASGGPSYISRVQELGASLFKVTLSDRARRHLQETSLKFLRLHLEDHLVHVPWELMHDGTDFLALRFAVGRVVSARAETAPGARLPADLSGHALVVSNPSGDLQHAVREGEAVAGLLRDGFVGEVRHLRGPVKKAQLQDALKGCGLLHFAGHAEPSTHQSPGGFRVEDGVVTAEEVAQAVGAAAPALVFANGCHASSANAFRDDGDGGSAPDLASALLLRGSRHFVGPRWEIADSDALTFALRFYERALNGIEFGEAVRLARRELTGPGARPLSFGCYVLYGEPRGSFLRSQVRATGETPIRSGPSREARPVPPSTRPPQQTAVPATPGSIDGVLAGVDARHGQPRSARSAYAVGGVVVALGALVAGGVTLMNRMSRTEERGGTVAIVTPGSPGTSEVAAGGASGRADPEPPPRAAATGPVRLCVLPFKNINGDKDLEFLRDGITESVMTDFGQSEGVRLIERAQIDLDIQELEFSQSKYVDPSTRSKIGAIHGAEVVLMGGFQRAGTAVRAHARFVDVETGEVLRAVRVEKAVSKKNPGALFDLQDELSAQVRASFPDVLARKRP